MAGLTVAAGLARGLLELAAAKGASVDTLATMSGIDPAGLDDQDKRIPLTSYVALTRAACALTGDPALALHYGETVDMSAFSIVGLIFPTCETLQESIVQVNRYGQLVVQVDIGQADRFQWIRRDGALWLADTRRDPNDFPELTEATFARFIAMTRRVGITGIVKEVHVTHACPAYAVDYDRAFGAPTMFEREWNAMRIEEAALARPIARQPRYAFGILSEHAEALLEALDHDETVRARVERLLMPDLHKGEVGIEKVAGEMRVSRQTLYRKLKAEGVTFEQVLDELRHQLAVHYLSGKKVSVHETAYLVGFSDPAAFSRAFKRWTGKSPQAFRAQ